MAATDIARDMHLPVCCLAWLILKSQVTAGQSQPQNQAIVITAV